MASASEPLKPPHQTPELMGADLPSFSWSRGVEALARLICLVVLLVVLCTGVYLGIQVFQRVGQLLINPDNLQPSVEKVATIIHADAMVVSAGEGKPNVELGRVAALALLGGGHFLWAAIAMQFVGVAGRCLLAMTKSQ